MLPCSMATLYCPSLVSIVLSQIQQAQCNCHTRKERLTSVALALWFQACRHTTPIRLLQRPGCLPAQVKGAATQMLCWALGPPPSLPHPTSGLTDRPLAPETMFGGGTLGFSHLQELRTTVILRLNLQRNSGQAVACLHVKSLVPPSSSSSSFSSSPSSLFFFLPLYLPLYGKERSLYPKAGSGAAVPVRASRAVPL